MIQLGLIGYPLGHSLSPKIHVAALKACGLEGNYSLFPTPPDDRQGLKDLLACIRSGEFRGLNVTIPHKKNVIELMDALTPTAQSIGAVNTIYLRENKLIGDNTDAPGFLSDLKRFLVQECGRSLSYMEEQTSPIQKRALVLGAGGSARAVVHALVNDDWSVTIAARRIERAQELARHFVDVNVIGLNFQTFQFPTFNLLVNTTPIGMTPNIDQSPCPENLPIPAAVIYDLVYNPHETKLVRDARAQGLQATTGLGMLIEQAALAFEIWTGHNPPRGILRSVTEN
jgi:shikimate dehydrogenase